jgi:ribulose-phosphate 3-epimerase
MNNLNKNIIPAIMPDTLQDIALSCDKVTEKVSWVQIDLMDKVFVESVSWPYQDGIFALKEAEELRKLISEYSELSFEVDLMVSNPETIAPVFANAGVKRIIFHHKSLSDPRAIDRFEEFHEDIEIGLALHIDDDISVIEQYLPKVSTIQFMGIEKVGYQGQEFAEAVLEKIKDAREKYPDMEIQVDGGVNTDTISKLKEAGVDRFVSGSAVFGGDVEENIKKLDSLV